MGGAIPPEHLRLADSGRTQSLVATADDGVATLVVTRDAVLVVATNIEMPRILDEELPGLDVKPVVVPWYENGLRG